MKKEKTIKTYQRRTKTGKVVTVKQHNAKYDAAEALKEAAKKKGAGEELDALKKKSQTKPAKEAAPKDDALGFTADEYKAWYHWDQDADPKNAAAKKVEKALKAKMGAKGYKKYFDEMTDSYSSRGHNKAFKSLGEKLSAGDDKKAVAPTKETKGSKDTKLTQKGPGEFVVSKTLTRYKGDPSELSVARRRGEQGYIIKTPSGMPLAKYDSASAARKALKEYQESATSSKGSKSKTSKETKTPKISDSSLKAKGYVSFKDYGTTLYIGKRGKAVYMKTSKGIVKADRDDYADFVTGHNGLSKANRKKLESLGWHEHEEY